MRVIDFMAATESPDSNSVKAGSFDGTDDGVLLLYGCDSIIVSSTNENWRTEKIRAGLEVLISLTQVLLVRAG